MINIIRYPLLEQSLILPSRNNLLVYFIYLSATLHPLKDNNIIMLNIKTLSNILTSELEFIYIQLCIYIIANTTVTFLNNIHLVGRPCNNFNLQKENFFCYKICILDINSRPIFKCPIFESLLLLSYNIVD